MYNILKIDIIIHITHNWKIALFSNFILNKNIELKILKPMAENLIDLGQMKHMETNNSK